MTEALTRLRDALAAKPIDDTAIKSAVCGYVDEMKKIGSPVEQLIVDIRRVAEGAIDPSHLVGKRAPSTPSEAWTIVDRAVTWCIEHYYRISAT